MASVQCCRPAEQACNQGQQGHSVGHKVTHVVSSVFKKDQTHHQQTMCQCQTTEGHGLIATTTTTEIQSKGRCRRNGEQRTRKRGLLQKIKDGISGHSDSGSSSSSESDSDDDKCGKCKN